MANTVNNTRQIAGKTHVVQYITLTSDGSEETDLVIYDSSAVATAIGQDDPTNCAVMCVQACVNAAATARVILEFDATTDVLALCVPSEMDSFQDFSRMGGLNNYSGSGKTGDITLTTTGLAAGDSLHIILHVRPR